MENQSGGGNANPGNEAVGFEIEHRRDAPHGS